MDGAGIKMSKDTVTLVLTNREANALFGHLSDYIEAHTDSGYYPPYNGEPELFDICEGLAIRKLEKY